VFINRVEQVKQGGRWSSRTLWNTPTGQGDGNHEQIILEVLIHTPIIFTRTT
jgi:hypothetical protein